MRWPTNVRITFYENYYNRKKLNEPKLEIENERKMQTTIITAVIIIMIMMLT